MANANNTRMSQFVYAYTKKLSLLQGVLSIVQEVKATLVTQGVTLTAAAFGTSGNSIRFTITGGATAGSEVVTVTGNSISIQIEDGVSTVTQVVTALQASAPSQALALATGSGAGAVAVATVLPLAGGIDGVAGISGAGIVSASQTGVGEFTITLKEIWPELMGCSFKLLSASAQDLIPQLKSQTVSTTKIIVVRTLAAAVATDPTSAATVYFSLLFRNSSVAY